MRKRLVQGLLATVTLAATWSVLHFAAGLFLDLETVSKWLEESASLKFLREDLRRALIEHAWKPLLALALTFLVATRTQLFQASADLLLERRARRLVQSDLINIPGDPPYFLPRQAEVARIKHDVLGGLNQMKGGRVQRVRKTGVSGMAGIGKSVIAASVARDKDVRRAFRDGLLWVTLGQEPNLVARQSQIAEALGDVQGRFEDWEKGKSRLSTLLADKACLLILDDVWSTEAVAAFDALGPRCWMLITTRDSRLLTAVGAVEHKLGVLGAQEALTLLAEWTGHVKALPREASQITKECGNLPLALAMIGAMVRGKQPDRWANALHKLRSADLQSVRQEFAGYPYPDLLKAIDVSVNALEQEAGAERLKYRERFLDMAVYPEDTSIPEAAIHSFWRPVGFDESSAQDVLDKLVDSSLLRRDDGNRFTIHDLHRDYVRANIGSLPIAYGAQIVARLTGHSGPILMVDVGADSHRAVSGSTDGTLMLWDVQNCLPLRTVTLSGHGASLTDVVTNGRHAVAASRDGTAKLWDVESGANLSTVHGRRVFSDDENDNGPIKLTTDGRFAVWLAQHTVKDINATPTTFSLCVWDLKSDGLAVRDINQAREGWSRYDDLSLSPDSKLAITPSHGKLQLWDLESGKLLRTVGQHSGPITDTAVTPDGRCIVSVSAAEGTPYGLRSYRASLNVWDVASGEKLHTLTTNSSISRIGFAPDGRTLICGSSRGTLQLWDLKSGASVRSIAAHSQEITVIQVTPSGLVISASEDSTLAIWDPNDWTTVASFGGGGSVRTCAVSADGTTMVVGTATGRVDVLRLTGHGR